MAKNWRDEAKERAGKVTDKKNAETETITLENTLTQYPISIRAGDLTRIKMIAADRGVSVQSILRESVEQWVGRHGKKKTKRASAKKAPRRGG